MSTLKSPLTSGFCEFLYAPIGVDDNGIPLTVLSMLARRDLDPWDEAAELTRLPRDIAIRRMAERLAAPTGPSSVQIDPDAAATRLIALLPRMPVAGKRPDGAPLRTLLMNASPVASRVMFFIIYVALIVFGQWMMASASGPLTAATSSEQTAAAHRVK